MHIDCGLALAQGASKEWQGTVQGEGQGVPLLLPHGPFWFMPVRCVQRVVV